MRLPLASTKIGQNLNQIPIILYSKTRYLPPIHQTITYSSAAQRIIKSIYTPQYKPIFFSRLLQQPSKPNHLIIAPLKLPSIFFKFQSNARYKDKIPPKTLKYKRNCSYCLSKRIILTISTFIINILNKKKKKKKQNLCNKTTMIPSRSFLKIVYSLTQAQPSNSKRKNIIPNTTNQGYTRYQLKWICKEIELINQMLMVMKRYQQKYKPRLLSMNSSTLSPIQINSHLLG